MTFGIDGGGRRFRHDNGANYNAYFGSMSLTLPLVGSTGKSSGFIMPASAWFSYGSKGQLEMGASLDLSIRTGSFTFGGSLEGRWPDAGTIPDPTSPGSTLDITDPTWFGYGLLAKINFGRSGRAFLQGRYAMLGIAVDLTQASVQESCVKITGDYCPPDGRPEYKSGRDLRLALGYVLGSRGTANILRLQYSRQRWDYVLEGSNQRGGWNRDVDQVSLGYLISF